MQLASCLYECKIAHARAKPHQHSFLHRHFMMYIDLDELDILQSKLWLFCKNRLSPYSFKPSDHMPDSKQSSSLQERVKNFLEEHGIHEPIGSIRLLTNVRFISYVFNPISFFFCFDKSGSPLCCVVEVGNTFAESKAYLVPVSSDGIRSKHNENAAHFLQRQQKLFYVSPFTELSQDFAFDFHLPNDKLDIRVDTMDGEEKIVATSMHGRRLAFTDKNLLWLTMRYPWAPLRVIALIHFHALLLHLKKIPFHRKEEAPEMQTAVMNPHKSLRKRSAVERKERSTQQS